MPTSRSGEPKSARAIHEIVARRHSPSWMKYLIGSAWVKFSEAPLGHAATTSVRGSLVATRPHRRHRPPAASFPRAQAREPKSRVGSATASMRRRASPRHEHVPLPKHSERAPGAAFGCGDSDRFAPRHPTLRARQDERARMVLRRPRLSDTNRGPVRNPLARRAAPGERPLSVYPRPRLFRTV